MHSAIVVPIAICLLVGFVAAQTPDQAFCNSVPIPIGPNEPIPNLNITSKFQMSIERNRADRGQTEEIQEYYDGIDNYGVSVNLFGGIEARVYSFYDTNEILVIKDTNCAVYELDKFIELTDFEVVTINGKRQIVTGLMLLLMNKDVQFSYLGNRNIIRGIPVKEWQTCIYSEKSKATLKITISFSDSSKWYPAIYLNGYTTFPVQFKIESKEAATGKLNTEFNVITQFRPGTLINMNEFNTPSGVFCPGRKNRQPIKFVVPEAFSFVSHIAVSAPNANDYSGSLSVARVDIDYGKQLARYDFYDRGQRITDIHDFDTGLSFRRNRYTGECTISPLDPNSNEPHQAYELFSFKSEPEFQYVGQRRIRGINTDVHIATRTFNGKTVTLEWHFMTDGFVVQETAGVGQNEPVLLKIQPVNDLTTPTFIQISSFDRTRIDYFDFDVSECGNTKNQHLKFTIDSDNYFDMQQNQRTVRLQILLTILNITTVNLVRISRLETLYDNGYVFVVFTLLDKQTLSGNPNRTKVDVSLEEAASKLQTAIDSGNFKFQFENADKKLVTITADPKSLIKLEQNFGRYVFNENIEEAGYSGGSLAGFIIGFLLIGAVIGLVGGVFLVLRRKTELPGPLSFLNPSYSSKSTPSA